MCIGKCMSPTDIPPPALPLGRRKTPTPRQDAASNEFKSCKITSSDAASEKTRTYMKKGQRPQVTSREAVCSAVNDLKRCRMRHYLPFRASIQQTNATSEAFQLMAISLDAYEPSTSIYDSSGKLDG